MANELKNEAALIPEDKIVFYELEKVRFVVKDGTGLDIAYAYEDLVFSEHGLFIIQFDGTSSNHWHCWFNSDCYEADRKRLMRSLTTSAVLNRVKLSFKGTFKMSQNKDKEEFTLRFTEN